MAGFVGDTWQKTTQSISALRRNLSRISKFNMDYQDMVIKNAQSIGRMESAFFTQDGGSGFTNADAYRWIAALQDTKVKKYIAYFDKDYIGKRDFLRKFSLNPEIEFILDTISNELVVQDERNYFAYPDIKNIDLKEKVETKLLENFKKIYMLFGFQNGILPWQYVRQFLVDGFICFEIVYANDGKEIVGFKELDPTSLQPIVEKTQDGRYEQYWLQYPKDGQMQRKLHDGQILYMSYAKGNSISRVSYVERLVRSYNILRIMENTRVIWNVMHSSYRLKFIIPVGSQSPQKALQTLGQLTARYKEEIELNDASGELTVNGRPKVQFYKNYLFPDKNGESPQIESLTPQGPDFNVMESVVYFYNKLKLDSKVPFARFSFKGGTPTNYQVTIDQMERDEIRFEKFLNRIRAIFKEILIKPLYLQMCLDFPELGGDKSFKTNLGLKYNKENEVSLKIHLSHLKKRASFIQGAKEIKERIGDKEESYFDDDFLIEEFMGLTRDEIAANKRYKEKLAKLAEKENKEEGGGEEGGEEKESFSL